MEDYCKRPVSLTDAERMIRAAILKAKEMGLQVFDFEGSIVPPIERYFRGFGGKLTPIFSVHKAWLPIEIGLKMMPKYSSRY